MFHLLKSLESDWPDDFYPTFNRNSAQRGSSFSLEALDPYDRSPFTAVPCGVLRGSCAIQPSDFRSTKLIAQPGSRIAFQLPQFTDHPERIGTAVGDRPSVGSQEQIRKFERVFYEADFSVDLLDHERRFPGAFFMAPVVRIDQRRALLVVKAGAVDRAPVLRHQSVADLMQ